MSARRFLDTNVLVYAVDEAEPDKQQRAQDTLAAGGPGEFVLSTQVLSEFYVVATRKLEPALPEDEAEAAVRRLRSLPTIPVDADIVTSAIRLSRREGVSLWDAQIIRAAVVGGCDRILTEDLAHGMTVDGVKVVDPFR